MAEALAEKLKANLPAEVFERFSAALLAGIGPKGLGENDSLTFLWCAPEALRILVRGQAVGADLSDAKLPKVRPAIGTFFSSARFFSSPRPVAERSRGL